MVKYVYESYSMRMLYYSRYRKLWEVFWVFFECKKKMLIFFVLVNFLIENDKVLIKIFFSDFNCVFFISIVFI